MKRIAIAVCVLALPLTAAALDGGALWTRDCQKCHGADGKGATKIGKKLKVKDYTDPKALAKLSDAELAKAIREGWGEPDEDGELPMPAFKKLAAADVTALVAHVRAFSGARPAAAVEKPVVEKPAPAAPKPAPAKVTPKPEPATKVEPAPAAMPAVEPEPQPAAEVKPAAEPAPTVEAPAAPEADAQPEPSAAPAAAEDGAPARQDLAAPEAPAPKKGGCASSGAAASLALPLLRPRRRRA